MFVFPEPPNKLVDELEGAAGAAPKPEKDVVGFGAARYSVSSEGP